MQLNPLVQDDSIPNATVVGEGDHAMHFYTVTVGTGETLTADIDVSTGPVGGPAFDPFFRVIVSDGFTVLATHPLSVSVTGHSKQILRIRATTSCLAAMAMVL